MCVFYEPFFFCFYLIDYCLGVANSCCFLPSVFVFDFRSHLLFLPHNLIGFSIMLYLILNSDSRAKQSVSGVSMF